MKYRLGDLVVGGCNTNIRRENDPGLVCIGGDACDVYASAAYEENESVRLIDVVVVSSIDLSDLSGQTLHDEVENMALNAINESYASIQSDTFLRSRKASIPEGEEIAV